MSRFQIISTCIWSSATVKRNVPSDSSNPTDETTGSLSESSDRPLEMPRNRFCNPSNNPMENLLFPRRTLSPYQPISGMSMSQQNEKSKQMENQNKPNSRSTSRHHGDVTQSHGDVMLQHESVVRRDGIQQGRNDPTHTRRPPYGSDHLHPLHKGRWVPALRRRVVTVRRARTAGPIHGSAGTHSNRDTQRNRPAMR